MDTAVLILRVVIGLYIGGHGAQKLFGWWGGHGLQATITALGGGLRLRPAWLWATSLAVAEFVGGVLMVLGLFGAIGPILVAGTMLGATLLAHWGKGPWISTGGYELTVTNLAASAAVALAGVGRYSLDAVLDLQVPLTVTEVVAVLVVVGVLVSVATRGAQLQPQTA